ncbi:MAG: hypothetical protein U0838_07100 [Chloroflexota bacterium]
MRGMLFGYSERFFERIRTYLLVTLALLVIAGAGIWREAIAIVPFLVPFAFLETGYLFFYTVFARRHAEYLERAINARFGRDVLVAHRLEAAYFYPPDAPKVAGISLGNPMGFMSAITVGYTVGAALLWAAGVRGILDLEQREVLLPAALIWTIAIALYLVLSGVRRADERRLLAELDAAYGAPSTPKS